MKGSCAHEAEIRFSGGVKIKCRKCGAQGRQTSKFFWRVFLVSLPFWFVLICLPDILPDSFSRIWKRVVQLVCMVPLVFAESWLAYRFLLRAQRKENLDRYISFE